MLRRRIAGLAVVAALVGGGVPAAGQAADSGRSADAPVAVSSKSCSRGKHAVIGGRHKCLARGQFCAGGKDRTYHKYGFHCHRRDSRGNYHLS